MKPIHTLVLADVTTSTERSLVRKWADSVYPGQLIVELEDLDDQVLDEHLTVQPVRVTWLPNQRASGDRLSAGELLLLAQPRRPWHPIQQVVTRIRPSGAEVTAAETATTAELRERYQERYGEGRADGFADFVRRQGVVSLDRAERITFGSRYKVPKLIAEQILDKPSFQDNLRELSQTLGLELASVTANAKEALGELIAVQSPVAIELWRTILKPMHAHAWDVDADSGALAELRELNKSRSLIFLPSHKSYVDPLIIADVLLEHDLPRNHTLGGANLSFWPFGPLGRRAGIVFIRRSFGGDEIYKTVVRHYLAHLMAKRFNLEWFMEGGRSRTGKLRQPKYGILRYLVDGLEIEPEADPVIIPVSVVYEQLHEVSTMAAEEMGAAKQPEGLSWAVRYLRGQREHLGDVAVRFGEPLPLREALDAAGEGRSKLEKVLFKVASRINAVTPATSTSLVTMVLLGERDRALTTDQIGHGVGHLLDYLDTKGVERPRDDLRHTNGLVATLDRLREAGVVEVYDEGTTPVWSIRPDRHHTAAFYRNGALHHLLNRAIAEMTLIYVAGLPEGVDHLDRGWEEALRLRDLLKFEFYFADKPTFSDELQTEAQLMAPGWEGGDLMAGQAGLALDRMLDGEGGENAPVITGPLVADQVLRSFLDAQAVSSQVLVSLGSGSRISAEDLVEDSLALGKQMVRQRRIHGVESVSQELFSGCASLADNRGLLAAGPDAQRLREEWKSEVCTMIDRLNMIRQLEGAATAVPDTAPHSEPTQLQHDSQSVDLTEG